MSPLVPWQPFYEIVGSAAGALTGLQFVVMALIADLPARAEDEEATDAFATPTIVHFVSVLMLSAAAVMPWSSLVAAAAVWGICGLAGFVYTVIVTRRMVQQNGYQPVAEDWAFHAVLPALAYLGLPAASVALLVHPAGALFGIAGSLLLLLAVGIHNAWDNVTFLVTLRRERLQLHLPAAAKPAGQPSPGA